MEITDDDLKVAREIFPGKGGWQRLLKQFGVQKAKKIKDIITQEPEEEPGEEPNEENTIPTVEIEDRKLPGFFVPGKRRKSHAEPQTGTSETPTKGGEVQTVTFSSTEAASKTPQGSSSPPHKTQDISDEHISSFIKCEEGEKYSLIIQNINKKDIDVIAFMGMYLKDMGYIPENHPSFIIPFALTFLYDQIKYELHLRDLQR